MNRIKQAFALAFVLMIPTMAASADGLSGLKDVRRVVFLGDSITYSGQYIETIDAYLALEFPGQKVELLNLGLPSETVSGLSEPGHAGGAFPRPDLHERLGRVLEKTKPDLVVACYGMNCGMYYPFSEERFEKFQAGIVRLRERAKEAGARVLHVTPPTFDPQPLKGRTLPTGLEEYRQPFEGYNSVLDKFAEWLLAQREKGWQVVDLHGPMNAYLAEQRKTKPAYVLAGDGVHMNDVGHWLAASQILMQLGASEQRIREANSAIELVENYRNGDMVLKLAQERQRLLKDAWLTEVGHSRPGMNKGVPLAEAQKRGHEITAKIISLTAPKPGE